MSWGCEKTESNATQRRNTADPEEERRKSMNRISMKALWGFVEKNKRADRHGNKKGVEADGPGRGRIHSTE